MTEDQSLLQQFIRERSEPAFGELVRLHIDLVYSTALRMVNGDRSLAQDVTQTVFIDLARKATSLPGGVVLAGWLHRHTCYTAATAVRTERRRKAREQTAMEMKELNDPAESPWELIAPRLDECLNQLSREDRDALVLRFLKRQDFQTLGATFGISEDAAQKRVSRALEKLRGILDRQGVALTVVALTTVLTAEAVTAAPVGLAAGVTAAAMTSAVGMGTALTTLKIMAATKFKMGILGALVIAGVATPWMIQQKASATLRVQDQTLRQQASQLAGLREENAQFSNQLAGAKNQPTNTDAQFTEVLRLRGEVGHLQAGVRDLAKADANEPLSRDDTLAAMRQLYQGRVKHLQDLFKANPAEAVPELQYLTESDWLGLVEYDHSGLSDDPDRLAMSSARSKAEIHFADGILFKALRQYGKNNQWQFPTDLSQLAPYFNPPLDATILPRWSILPTADLPESMRIDEPQVVTLKTPVNEEHDQRVVVGLKTVRLGSGGDKQWTSSKP